MGKIKENLIIKEVRGNIGHDLYVRKSRGNTIVSRKGIVRRSSKDQQANRERFAQAALHARGAMMESELSRVGASGFKSVLNVKCFNLLN